MPVKAAGWRTEPPVSVPVAPGARNAATAAAEPPEEPPGTSLVFAPLRRHGDVTAPKHDVSFDEPIANSSLLVLPSSTAPSRHRLPLTVTTSGRFFMVIGVTDVIGSTPLTSTSDNCSTKARMALSSPLRCSTSSSVTAMRARCAMRRTVLASTDMDTLSANPISVPAPIAEPHFTGQPPRLYRDRLALLGHDDFGGMPLHRGDEFVGGRLDNGERAVMARKHRVELEEALDRERRGFRAHGEAVPNRHHGDPGLMQLGDQCHVAEHVGIAHMIDGRLAWRGDDGAARIAEIDRHAVLDVAGRMVGAHQRHREAALVRGPSGVHGIELFQALGGEPHAQIVVGDHRHAG